MLSPGGASTGKNDRWPQPQKRPFGIGGRAGTRESFGRRSPVAQSSKTGLLELRLRFSSVLMKVFGGPVAFREVALRRSCRFASVRSNGYTTLTFLSTVSTYPTRNDFCTCWFRSGFFSIAEFSLP